MPTTPAAPPRSSAWSLPRAGWDYQDSDKLQVTSDKWVAPTCHSSLVTCHLEIVLDTSLNEVQRQIQTAARDFFRDNCPTTLVRSLEQDERGYASDLWRQLADLGWL